MIKYDLHDSLIEAVNYAADQKRVEIQIELCNWRQIDYKTSDPEIKSVHMIFDGVEKYELSLSDHIFCGDTILDVIEMDDRMVKIVFLTDDDAETIMIKAQKIRFHDMFNINDKMKKMISAGSDFEHEKKYMRCLEEIISKAKIVGDCVIYDDEGISESDINWEKILKIVTNLTGFEVGCNEFRFEMSELEITQCREFAYDMRDMLQDKFIERQFVVYVCVNDEDVDVRFHTYREEEGFWLVEDLNTYDNAIFWLM